MLLGKAASLRYFSCGSIAYANYGHPYRNTHSESDHARVIAEYVASNYAKRRAIDQQLELLIHITNVPLIYGSIHIRT